MKINYHWLLLLLAALFMKAPKALAQSRYLEDVTGKIEGRRSDGKGWHFEMLDNMEAHKKYYPEMKSKALRVFSTVIGAPVVHPPKGFDLKPFISVYQKTKAFPAGAVFSGLIELKCFNYTADLHGPNKMHKQDESHGNMKININDLENTYQVEYATGNTCAHIGYPDIFFLPEIHKVTDTRLLINNDYMVLKKPGRPVFIPLTIKEYDEFMIRKIRYDLDQTTHPDERINKLLQQYQSTLHDLSREDGALPVYVVNDYSDHYPDYDYFYKPAADSTAGARELFRLNPDYYDKTLPQTAIQLISIHYHASGFCPDFERQALKRWFEQIDYPQLQHLIR